MVHPATVLSSVTLGAVVLATACSPSAAEGRPYNSETAPASSAHPCGQNRPKSIDMATLAWLAEQADGKRNRPLRLVVDTAGELELRDWGKPVKTSECDTKLKVETSALKDRADVDVVIVQPKNGTSTRLPSDEDYDAVFWRESSVEKFVWPYYHSHRLWDKHIDSVKTRFDTLKTALAIAHQAPSKPTIPGPQARTRSASPADELSIGVLQNGKVTWIDTDSFLNIR